MSQIAAGIVKSIGLRMRAHPSPDAADLASCHLSRDDELSVLHRKHVDGDGWWLQVKVITSKNRNAVGKTGWVKQSTKDDGTLVEVTYEVSPIGPQYPIEPWWLLAGIITIIVIAILLFVR